MQNQNEMSNRETSAELFSRPDAAPQEGAQEGAQEGEQARTGELPLEEQLARAESSLAEMQDAFLRAKAEMENLRRRAREDIASAHKYAIGNFAESLLPVKDSLEMALQVETPSVESLREGVNMTLKQLSSAFERNRVTEVDPKPGDRFDPDRHQAISMIPSTQPSNTVVNVLQKGYLIADRLLRPALITVAQSTTGGNSS
ncbi:molecular chaperone GrpE [Paucimonas lemoignei]|uniref:Protein GrpE n=1 Tax=Paucimonas lemoignei TaxID=29443 RepID=A0A4R3HRH1_PAULE|nr:nucleotide exchange factor GrpE [Paucimonas lemoignei]TCS32587.1 molecular chaperone GrpE [Paucimonas lemoignei]